MLLSNSVYTFYRPLFFFFFNDPATPEIYPLSLHDALPISTRAVTDAGAGLFARVERLRAALAKPQPGYLEANLGLDDVRSEEHTSELQSRLHLVCRLLLEKKNIDRKKHSIDTHGIEYFTRA